MWRVDTTALIAARDVTIEEGIIGWTEGAGLIVKAETSCDFFKLSLLSRSALGEAVLNTWEDGCWCKQQAWCVLLALLIVCITKTKGPGQVVRRVPISFTEGAKRIQLIRATAEEVCAVARKAGCNTQSFRGVEEHIIVRFADGIEFQGANDEVERAIIIRLETSFERRGLKVGA